MSGGFTGMQMLASIGPGRAGIFGWYVVTGACAGVIAGLVFWLVRHPDREVLSAPLRLTGPERRQSRRAGRLNQSIP